MGERRDAWEAILLSLMGRVDPRPGPGTVRYQLLLAPTFHMPSCLEIEETARRVVLALVILQDGDALNAAATIFWRDGTWEPLPANVAKGRCWEDLVELPPDQQAAFRRLCSDVDPWELGDAELAERDGIGIRLRCEAPGRSRTMHMSSPSQAQTPAHHRWVTSLLDLAEAGFPEQHCLDYLATLRRSMSH